ncbi:MAG TPA: heme lyase CcmF/NrfE family subunit [Steroidobacteraceae bacterium]|jgi:cytochrome c-type biogenesis protein CcmF|nr:heme lyase CcmF/NrfE family subunit [Steroidobacteraceae bacterium]
MLPELGHFALVLALVLAALQAFFGIVGPAVGRDRWVAATTSAVAGQFVMVATAVGILVYSFVNFDFSVKYVFENSNSALPLMYRIAALWGAHEGSLLLWIFLLSVWTLAVAIAARNLPERFAARVLGVLGVLSFGFLLFTLATSDPFLRLLPAAADGRDLNPLLQDPGLAVHPPVLYTGYVGLAVAFSFACAAMLEGRMDPDWARWTRPWTTAAWAFLTCGITLGSWWSYYTLGWGGYWEWDPVENASFMPWLVATALIHSLAVTEKRGLFKSWTLLLAILAFSLSLLGTFLVRSGVLVSVHSFAADPSRGRFILVFLGIVIGGALALYAWRAPLLKSNAGFELLSRESFLLFNNILLVVAAATVLGGTLAPLIADTFGQPSLSVGPPYFRPTFLLAVIPLLLLLGVGVHANWKRGRLEATARPLLITAVVAGLLGAAVVFGAFGGRHALAITGFGIGGWIILSSLIDPVDRLRRHLSLSRAVIGMTMAHIGLAVAVIALTGVESYTSEQDIALSSGESANVGGYDFKLTGTRPVEGANYSAIRATVIVTRDGRPITTLYPESRTFWVQQQTRKVAGIYNRHGTDVFIALGDDLGAGRWSFRAQIRPLITLLWLGPLFMALGGALALSDRRYRLARAAARARVPGARGEAY